MIEAGTIELIEAKEVLHRLAADLNQEPHVWLWCYTVQPKFFDRMFIAPRPGKQTRVILDYRQRHRLAEFYETTPGLEVRHWQRNRTQHDKTILCASNGILWITTSNLHQGSFMLANNRAIRITTSHIVNQVSDHFTAQWRISQPAEEGLKP